MSGCSSEGELGLLFFKCCGVQKKDIGKQWEHNHFNNVRALLGIIQISILFFLASINIRKSPKRLRTKEPIPHYCFSTTELLDVWVGGKKDKTPVLVGEGNCGSWRNVGSCLNYCLFKLLHQCFREYLKLDQILCKLVCYPY